MKFRILGISGRLSNTGRSYQRVLRYRNLYEIDLEILKKGIAFPPAMC